MGPDVERSLNGEHRWFSTPANAFGAKTCTSSGQSLFMPFQKIKQSWSRDEETSGAEEQCIDHGGGRCNRFTHASKPRDRTELEQTVQTTGHTSPSTLPHGSTRFYQMYLGSWTR